MTSLSTLSTLIYTLMVYGLIEPVLLYDRVMIRRMNEGRFPYVVVLICMVPALATGVGMSIRNAMYASACNIVLLAFVTRKMFTIVESIVEQDGADTNYLKVSLINDFIVLGAFWTLAWWACASPSEAGEQFVAHIRAGRMPTRS